MSKKTKTAAISFPTELLNKIDEISTNAHISRSAFVTAMTSFIIRWSEETSAQVKKEALNSLYGKKG